MTAHDILDLLSARHIKDVFVPECKDGSTTMGSHRRLDAWAMRRSWAKPMTWGYEIKVSRADWLQDTKFEAYRPLVRCLSIVAPKGLVKASEIPDGIGFYEVIGHRMVTRTKPVASSDPPLEETNLLRYVLMCRARIGRHHDLAEVESSRIEKWRAWLAGKEESREIGYLVSKSLRQKYDHDVVRVEAENRMLKAKEAQVNNAHEKLLEAGLLDTWLRAEDRGNRVRAYLDGYEPGLPADLRFAASRLIAIADTLETGTTATEGQGGDS